MLHLLLGTLVSGGLTAPEVTTSQMAVEAPVLDEAYEKRLAEAGKDAAKLWKLVEWCLDTERDKEAASVARKVIRSAPDHREAREFLGHIRYEGEWFTSEKKLEEYKAKELEREAKAKGWVKFEKTWVPPEDLPFLKDGFVRGPDGGWWTLEDLEKHEAGWLKQDLVWVDPADADKIDQGLWLCGEEWLSLSDAERYHSDPRRPWEIPSDHLILRTTCSRETATAAIAQMEAGFRELSRIFGKVPGHQVEVFLSGRSDVLGAMCSPGIEGLPAIERRGLIESLEAVFAESWYDEEAELWRGAGCSWWDPEEENGDRFGPHRARFAFGLSVVDAIDPSPKAVAAVKKKGEVKDDFAEKFYKEKELPQWLGWGAAVYTSRFYPDQVGAGGDPFWTRTWSLDNLKRRGGMPDLDAVFEMELSGREGDTRSVLAAGALVAFILDGECVPVRAAHAEFKAALRSGKDVKKKLARLRKAIEDQQEALSAFVGS